MGLVTSIFDQPLSQCQYFELYFYRIFRYIINGAEGKFDYICYLYRQHLAGLISSSQINLGVVTLGGINNILVGINNILGGTVISHRNLFYFFYFPTTTKKHIRREGTGYKIVFWTNILNDHRGRSILVVLHRQITD